MSSKNMSLDLKYQICSLINKINGLHDDERRETLIFLQKCIMKNIHDIENKIQGEKPQNMKDCNDKFSKRGMAKLIKPKLKNGKVYRKSYINFKSKQILRLVTVLPYRDRKIQQKQNKFKSSIKYFKEIKFMTHARHRRRSYNYQCESYHNINTSTKDIKEQEKDPIELLNNDNRSEYISNDKLFGESIESESKFKCQKCDQIFLRKQQFSLHMKHHNKYKCRDCSLTFSSQKHALKHRKQTIITDGEILREHDVEGLESLEMKCFLCPRIFQRTKKLKEHMQAHAVDSLISCPICNASYRNRNAYEAHIESSGHDKPMKEIEQVDKLEEHNSSYKEVCTDTNDNQEDVNLICDICGKAFSKRASLVQHKKRNHSQVRFTCEICNFSSKSRSNLRRHLTSHTSERPVICEQCGTAFRNSSALKEHSLYAHQEESHHQCELCPKKFKVKSALSRHMQSCHSNERRYACRWCKQAYKRSSHLRRHEIQRHSDLRNVEIGTSLQQNSNEKIDATSELAAEHDFVDKQFDDEVYMDIQWNSNIPNSQADKNEFNKMDPARQQSLLNLMSVDAAELVVMSSKSNTIKQLVSDIDVDYIPSSSDMPYQTLWPEKQDMHTITVGNRDNIVKYDHETLPKSYMDKFVTTMDLNGETHNVMYMQNSDGHKLTDISNAFTENEDVDAMHSNINQALQQELQQTFTHNEDCNNVILMEHSSLQCEIADDLCDKVTNEHNDNLSVLSSFSDYIQTPFQYV